MEILKSCGRTTYHFLVQQTFGLSRFKGLIQGRGAALESAQALAPDVVVTDVDMPRMDESTMIERLHEVAPDIAPIVLTVDDHEAAQERARAADAKAFICKQEDIEQLIEAIRRVAPSTIIDNQEA
jgi:DNA-binding NarL/FixJ family response regulator